MNTTKQNFGRYKGVGWLITLKDAQSKLKHLQNQRDYWLREKELKLSGMLPKAISIKEDVVVGGTRIDRYAEYVIKVEEIDDTLKKLDKEIANISDYIVGELEAIGMLEPVQKKVVELKLLDNKTWNQISVITGLSRDYCRKLFRKHMNKRYFEK